MAMMCRNFMLQISATQEVLLTVQVAPTRLSMGANASEAIFDFLDGNVKLNSEMRYLTDNSIKLGGMTARDLEREHSRIFQRIQSFPLSVMSVITNQVDRINDLFVRLNKSKPLTGSGSPKRHDRRDPSIH